MIYVYAFIEHPEQVDASLRGLAEAPVVALDAGGVTAACSFHDDLDLHGDVDELWQHERVTAALLGEAGVVPARFGTAVADTDGLGLAVDARRPNLLASLVRLRGKVELGVHGAVAMSAKTERDDIRGREDHEAVAARTVEQVASAMPDRAGGGRDYLRGLASDRSPGLGPELAVVHAALASAADDHRLLAGRGEALTAAYLLDRTATEEFQHHLVAERRRNPAVRLSLTGPWAPYHFVDQESMRCA